MKRKNSKLGFATRAIHEGNQPDPTTGAISPAIYATSTYVQEAPAKHLGYEYSRTHNPTRSRLEECLNSLERGKGCITTSSGMSAMSLILHSLPEKAKVLCGDDVYGGTYRQLTTIFNKKLNICFSFPGIKIFLSHFDYLNKSPLVVYRETLIKRNFQISYLNV